MPAERAAAGGSAPVAAKAVDGGLRVSGPLGFDNARDALATLSSALPSGGSMAVDLSGLQRSDSAGLAVLVEWRAVAARRGVHLRLGQAPEGLRALARLSDLDAELFD